MKYSWKHRCDASPLLLQIDNGLAASPEPSFSVTERSKELIVLLMYDYVIPLNTLPLKRLRPPGLQIPNLKWSRGFLPLAPKQLSSNMSWTEIHREKVLWLFFFFFRDPISKASGQEVFSTWFIFVQKDGRDPIVGCSPLDLQKDTGSGSICF